MNQSLFDLSYVTHFLTRQRLNTIESGIIKACEEKLKKPHGDVQKWQTALNELTKIDQAKLIIDHNDTVCLTGHLADTGDLDNQLKAFCPWRKGPFQFLETFINTEWQSQKKWQRIKSLGISFQDKNVLDIGCGNGYFLWQIATQAQSVIGIDPMWLFYHQFMLFQRYAKQQNICFLPIGIESVPEKNCFDSVLSMGVLYHRKSPIEHLITIKNLLKPRGEMILETIILPNHDHQLLTPSDRYAGMRNVWMIPSLAVLKDWVIKAGFTIKNVSPVVQTTIDEQRQTEWMDYHSLNQFLDSSTNKTIEGHPAPHRVIIQATS